MSIVEKERLTKHEKTVALTLETPLGILNISPTKIEFLRDEGNHMVEIHKFGCRVVKYRKANHDDLDLQDIPWKSVFIDLGDKDRIDISRSNSSWEIVER